MKRAFIYVRVSTAEQVDGYSVDEQIDRLTAYCTALNWTIIKRYVDAGFSGSNTDRPALRDLIEDVKKRAGDVVLVYKLDRLSRSQKDTLTLIEDIFLANGIDFVSISENFDTSSPFGKAMIGILAVFAQLEREQIKERMTMGRVGRAKEGKFHGSRCIPIGYEYTNGDLVVNDFEAMQVREAFDLYLTGYSFRRIEREFSEKGYHHKYGNWHKDRIRKCLLNPVYVGMVKFNGVYYQGVHAPIVDQKTFDAVQSLYKSQYKKPAHTESVLGGMLFCKQCSARYGIVVRHGSKGQTYRYYTCYSRRHMYGMATAPDCKNKIWKCDELEAVIFNEVRKLTADQSRFHEKQDETKKKNATIRKEVARIDAQRKRLVDLYGLGQFSVEEIQKAIEPLNARKARLENDLQDDDTLTTEEVKRHARSLSEALEHGSVEQIRTLLRLLIDRIDLDGDDVYIHWNF